MVASCQKGTSNFDDSQVFRYNEHSNITSLDPAFAKDQRNIWVVNQLYNGLVQLDDSLQVKPSITKNWDISEKIIIPNRFSENGLLELLFCINWMK